MRDLSSGSTGLTFEIIAFKLINFTSVNFEKSICTWITIRVVDKMNTKRYFPGTWDKKMCKLFIPLPK